MSIDVQSQIGEVLGTDADRLTAMSERIVEDLPAVGALYEAGQQFCVSLHEMDDDQIYSEAYDLRRSELALMLGLLDEIRIFLAVILKALNLEDRLADPETADSIQEGLEAVGEAMTDSARQLVEVPGRDG